MQTGPKDGAGRARRLMLVILAAAALLGGCLQSAEDQCFTFDNTSDANASSVCAGGESSSSDSSSGNVAIVQVSTVSDVVVISNSGLSDEDLTDWTLTNEVSGDTADIFTFPSFILGDGDFVRVHSITGTDDANDLYWDGGDHWDTLDSIAMKDETDLTIDTCGDGDTCWDDGS